MWKREGAKDIAIRSDNREKKSTQTFFDNF